MAVRLEELLAVPVALPEELRVPVPVAEGEPEPVSTPLMLLLRVGLLLLQELAEELPEALEQELWLAEPEKEALEVGDTVTPEEALPLMLAVPLPEGDVLGVAEPEAEAEAVTETVGVSTAEAVALAV